MDTWHHTVIREEVSPYYVNNSNKQTELTLIGDTLRQIRLEQQRTQENIAESANISPRYYQSLEAGNSSIGILIIFKLCQALDCHYTQLLEPAWKHLSNTHKPS